jgi:hypothetical protein
MHASVAVSDQRGDLMHSDDDLMILQRRNGGVQFRDDALELLVRSGVIKILVSLREFSGEVPQVFTPLLLCERGWLSGFLRGVLDRYEAATKERCDADRCY